MQTTRNKILTVITLLVIVLAIGAIVYSIFNKKSTNPVINTNDPQKTEVIKVNDSISILKQLLYLAESRAALLSPTEQVIRDAIKAAKINPTDVATWKSIYSGSKRSIQMNDSFNIKIDAILESQKNLLLSGTEAEKIALQQKYDKQLSDLMSTRIKFLEETKYRKLGGDYGLSSKINITRDSVISEPFVVFGEKNKFLGLGRSEYSAIIGDKNPAISQSSVYTASYKPKPKLQVGIGPMVLANNQSINVGAGVVLKRGIFTISAGYSLYNKQFKP